MIETMKGYKALDKNMNAIFGNGMGYRLNKWYKIRSNIKINERGYHFFGNIRDIFILFHYKEEYNIYEIKAKGNIVKGNINSKCVCSEIKIIRKLSKEEIDKYIEDNLEELINDKDWRVRVKVASRGFGLDKLINDKDVDVRCEAAMKLNRK